MKFASITKSQGLSFSVCNGMHLMLLISKQWRNHAAVQWLINIPVAVLTEAHLIKANTLTFSAGDMGSLSPRKP